MGALQPDGSTKVFRKPLDLQWNEGRIVMQGVVGTNVQFSKSDDGGVTWSAPVTIALGFTWAANQNNPKPVWTGSRWVAIATDRTTKTRVFSSTDGVTWTSVLLNSAFGNIQCAGELLLMTSTLANGSMAFSTDGGATWRWSDVVLPLSDVTIWVAFNGQRFAIFGTSSKVYVGHAIGSGVSAVT